MSKIPHTENSVHDSKRQKMLRNLVDRSCSETIQSLRNRNDHIPEVSDKFLIEVVCVRQ